MLIKTRVRDIAMVKEWIEAASLMGAAVIRVFTGQKVAEGTTFDKTLEWMIPAFKERAEHGAREVDHRQGRLPQGAADRDAGRRRSESEGGVVPAEGSVCVWLIGGRVHGPWALGLDESWAKN